MTANPAAAEPTSTPGTDQLRREPLRYRGLRLDGPAREFHAAIDAPEADTVPYSYYLKVLAGRDHRAAAER